MRVRDVDLAHPPRSYAMLLVRLAIACVVPFAPVYLLVVVTGIMVGLDPLLVGMLRLAFTASVSMTIHELVHACLLSWRNPDMRVSISTDWLRMMVYRKAPLPILQALACAVLGPCAGVMTAMCLTGLYGPSFGWLVVIQQMVCLIPPCDDGVAVVRCIWTLVSRGRKRGIGWKETR